MVRPMLTLGLLLFASSAAAQPGGSMPRELPTRLEVTLERPDVPHAFLHLSLERTAAGAEIVGCQTTARDVGCRRTRRISMSGSEVATLERYWRSHAAGGACRIRRPAGNWKPFTLSYDGASVEAIVYERADAGLSTRCFPLERIGGLFLRVFRDAA